MARNNNEQRNIALNFVTNAEQTKSKIDALLNSLDDTTEEYAELQQQSVSLASAITDVNNAMEHGSESSNILNTSVSKLEKETNKAAQSFNKINTVTNKQTKSTKDLTKEVTSNGGAMAILDTITGGLASTTRNALEATTLFTSGTNSSSIAQRAYAAVVGTSTGALKAFRIALAATGVGLAIVAIGALVTNWNKLTTAIGLSNNALSEHQERLNIVNKQTDVYDKTIKRQANNLLEIAKNTKLTNAERIEAVKQLQDLLAIENKLTDTQIKAAINDTKILDSIISANTLRLTNKEKQVKLEEENKRLLEQQADLTEKINKEPSFWEQVKSAPRGILEDLKGSFESIINLERYDKPSPSEVVINNLKKELKEVNDQIEKNQESLKELTLANVSAEAANKLFNATIEEGNEVVDNFEDKLKEITQTIIQLRRAYEINVAEGAIAKLYKEEEINIRNLNDARKEQLDLNKSILGSNKVALEQYNKIVNEYYDSEISKSNEKINIIKNNEEEFNRLMIENSELLKNNSYDSLRQIEYNVDSFIRTIKDPEIKQAYLELFNVDSVRELASFIKQFQPELQRYVADLVDYNVQVFDPLTIDREKAVINAIKNTNINKLQLALENSLSLLKIEEDEAIKKAEMLKASEEELANIRKFYADKRTEETERTNGLIVDEERNRTEAINEIDQIAFDQKVMIADATASLLEATASLLGEHTAGYKTLAIAQTTIDTYTSAMSAYKGMVQAIPGPVGIAAGAVAAAASVVTGISNVKKILAVKTPGGSGGGSAPSAASATPNVSFVSSSENQIANSVTGAMNNTNQEPIKAYVVSSDVTTAQSLELNKIESNSI